MPSVSLKKHRMNILKNLKKATKTSVSNNQIAVKDNVLPSCTFASWCRNLPYRYIIIIYDNNYADCQDNGINGEMIINILNVSTTIKTTTKTTTTTTTSSSRWRRSSSSSSATLLLLLLLVVIVVAEKEVAEEDEVVVVVFCCCCCCISNNSRTSCRTKAHTSSVLKNNEVFIILKVIWNVIVNIITLLCSSKG